MFRLWENIGSLQGLQLSLQPSSLPLRHPGPWHHPALGHPLHLLNPACASFLPVYSTPFSNLPSVLALSFLVHGLFSPVSRALSRMDRTALCLPDGSGTSVHIPCHPPPPLFAQLVTALLSLIPASSLSCLHHQVSLVAMS